jgi:hypothetical protein
VVIYHAVDGVQFKTNDSGKLESWNSFFEWKYPELVQPVRAEKLGTSRTGKD